LALLPWGTTEPEGIDRRMATTSIDGDDESDSYLPALEQAAARVGLAYGFVSSRVAARLPGVLGHSSNVDVGDDSDDASVAPVVGVCVGDLAHALLRDVRDCLSSDDIHGASTSAIALVVMAMQTQGSLVGYASSCRAKAAALQAIALLGQESCS